LGGDVFGGVLERGFRLIETAGYSACVIVDRGETHDGIDLLYVSDEVTDVNLSASPTSLIEGQKVKLTCTSVGGKPVPILTLSSAGSQWINKSSQTKTFSVEAVVRRDDTEVVCTAQGQKVNLTDKVTLDIKCKFALCVFISFNSRHACH
jgi:hypothetical protein